MKRVLIVDDDKLARLGIMTLLPWSKYGMEVVGDVQNGRSALDFLKSHPVDIAFVDLDMPVMDGLTFIQRSRALYPELLYVVLTFYESFSIAQKVWRLGVIDYISKMELESIDADLVLQRIEAKIGERQAVVLTEEEGGADDGQWHPFLREWDDLYWLYDRFRYRQLCLRAEAMNPSLRQLEHLLARLLPLLREHAGCEEPSLPAMQREKVVSWLSDYRRKLLSQLAEGAAAPGYQPSIARVVCYAEEHLAQTLHTEDMARLINMSRSHFSQLFKRCVGVPFNEYIQRIRALKAMGLLTDTALPVDEIARRTGYEDVKHFSLVFSRHVGETPREYRKRRQ